MARGISRPSPRRGTRNSHRFDGLEALWPFDLVNCRSGAATIAFTREMRVAHRDAHDATALHLRAGPLRHRLRGPAIPGACPDPPFPRARLLYTLRIHRALFLALVFAV